MAGLNANATELRKVLSVKYSDIFVSTCQKCLGCLSSFKAGVTYSIPLITFKKQSTSMNNTNK